MDAAAENTSSKQVGEDFIPLTLSLGQPKYHDYHSKLNLFAEFKLLLLGDSFVGKRTLADRILCRDFEKKSYGNIKIGANLIRFNH